MISWLQGATYRFSLDEALVSEAFRTRPAGRVNDWRAKASAFAALRLDPLDSYLGRRAGLPAVKHLVILTSPDLAGLPVEALLEARPPSLPRYTVSYAPSGTMLAWLRERSRPKGNPDAVPRRLLALGDPLFESSDPQDRPPAPPKQGLLVQRVLPGSAAARGGIVAGDILLRLDNTPLNRTEDLWASAGFDSSQESGHAVAVWRDGTVLELKLPPGVMNAIIDSRPTAEAIAARRSVDERLRQSRAEVPAPLPGSRDEVEAIARLFDQKEVLLVADASESRLDALARADSLRRFDVLHFATHGVLNRQASMRSALLLATPPHSDAFQQVLQGEPVFDGELTAAQILRTWRLDAELVTLSACETALGQRTGGEGYLGFSQALFLAGARSLVLSLWKVDDRASALLMTRFYENLLGRRNGRERPLPKGEALSEAKQWLRGLTTEQAAAAHFAQERGRIRPSPGGEAPKVIPEQAPYNHPYYWAAFILVGDPW